MFGIVKLIDFISLFVFCLKHSCLLLHIYTKCAQNKDTKTKNRIPLTLNSFCQFDLFIIGIIKSLIVIILIGWSFIKLKWNSNILRIWLIAIWVLLIDLYLMADFCLLNVTLFLKNLLPSWLFFLLLNHRDFQKWILEFIS